MCFSIGIRQRFQCCIQLVRCVSQEEIRACSTNTSVTGQDRTSAEDCRSFTTSSRSSSTRTNRHSNSELSFLLVARSLVAVRKILSSSCIWPKLSHAESHGLFVTAKLLVLFSLPIFSVAFLCILHHLDIPQKCIHRGARSTVISASLQWLPVFCLCQSSSYLGTVLITGQNSGLVIAISNTC